MNFSKRVFDLISLEGKTSIITGGAGHLGSAISETLAELGSNIIIVGKRRNEGTNFANELSKEFGIKANFEEVDINSKNSINDLFEKKIKNADVLINNAFTWPTKVKLEETSWNDFEDATTSGITSPFYFTLKIIEKMKENRNGSIVNIASMYGMVSPNFKIYHNKPKMGNAISYNASKAALIQMTRYFAAYCGQWNIRVNAISPGPFPKPGTFSGGKEWFEKELKEMNPLNKLGEPWQLKGAIALLSSDLGSYITGQNIPIDGGWTIW